MKYLVIIGLIVLGLVGWAGIIAWQILNDPNTYE